MVTVVSREPHPSVVKEIICKNCGSTLQYVPKDINRKIVRDYLGDSDSVSYIKCPECSCEITVKPAYLS